MSSYDLPPSTVTTDPTAPQYEFIYASVDVPEGESHSSLYQLGLLIARDTIFDPRNHDPDLGPKASLRSMESFDGALEGEVPDIGELAARHSELRQALSDLTLGETVAPLEEVYA